MTAPAFLETSPATILAALVSDYETALGRELYPAQFTLSKGRVPMNLSESIVAKLIGKR